MQEIIRSKKIKVRKEEVVAGKEEEEAVVGKRMSGAELCR